MLGEAVHPERVRDLLTAGHDLIGVPDNQPDAFVAVCVRCPHEACDVDFVSDPTLLPQDVEDEIAEVEEDVLIFA